MKCEKVCTEFPDDFKQMVSEAFGGSKIIQQIAVNNSCLFDRIILYSIINLERRILELTLSNDNDKYEKIRILKSELKAKGEVYHKYIQLVRFK